MIVAFLHGPIGIGKYTIGKQLSEITGLPLFHNHLVVDMATSIFEFGSDGFKDLRESAWLKSFEIAAREKKSFIFTFSPESTVDPALIKKLVEVVESYQGKILFIELVAQEETVLKRLQSEERKKFGKLRDPVLFKKLKDNGDFSFPPMPSCFLKIDTDMYDPSQSAKLIFDELPVDF